MTGTFSVIEYFNDGESAYVECGIGASRALSVAGKRSRQACKLGNVMRVVIVNDDNSATVLDWQRSVGTVTGAFWRIA